MYTVCGYQWAGPFYVIYTCNEETWSNENNTEWDEHQTSQDEE